MFLLAGVVVFYHAAPLTSCFPLLLQANQADERGDLKSGDRGDPLQRDFGSHDCQALLVAADVVAAQPGVELQPQVGIRVVKWLPFYGAAILAISAGASYAPDNVHLHVIGLDGWRFETHRYDLAGSARSTLVRRITPATIALVYRSGVVLGQGCV
jgi:hypothetical protein